MRISDWSSDVCSSDLDDVVLRTDPLTGATSHLLTIEIERRSNPVSLERILRIADGDASARFMINRKSGKAALRTRARALMEATEGTPIQRVERMRATHKDSTRTDIMYTYQRHEVNRENPRTPLLENEGARPPH